MKDRVWLCDTPRALWSRFCRKNMCGRGFWETATDKGLMEEKGDTSASLLFHCLFLSFKYFTQLSYRLPFSTRGNLEAPPTFPISSRMKS